MKNKVALKLLKIKAKVFVSLTLFFLSVSLLNAQFVHPGSLHKKSDLDRMKYMVEAKVEPYLSTYNKLKVHSKASFLYTVQGDTSMTVGTDGLISSDGAAAYLNALMWYITGDERHAQKCVEIFNAWVNVTQTNGFALRSGTSSWKLIEGAEIIKSTYSGWQEEDIDKFKAMLVYPGYSNTTIPTGNKSFYWNILNGDPGRHGNQDAIAFRAMISMGVFLDNKIMYDRALNYFKGLPHRADDIPYATGPGVSGSVKSDNPYFTNYQNSNPGTIPDYGFNGTLDYYFWENGQCQESSRDQAHVYFGLGIFEMLAEVAWNQGDDAWNYLDNRLLKGFEFNSKYNISYIESYPDQPEPWEPTVESGEFIERTDRSGRWKSKAINPHYEGDFVSISRGNFLGKRPIYEMAMAHFDARMGFSEEQTLWTGRGLELYGIEENGWTVDHAGWGGLSFHRPKGCAGDPIYGFDTNGLPVFKMNELPMTIEAENYDYFVSDGQARSYGDRTIENSGGAYRTLDGVDIETKAGEGYAITAIEPGEWLSYTVAVPERATYSITVNYAALQSGGTMRFSFGNVDKTTDLEVPFGAPNSTGDTDWKTYVIAEDIVLDQGVQSFKIMFNGTSEAFKLDSFSIVKTGIAKEDQTIQFFTISDKVVGSADFEPETQASSGLAVRYSSSNPSVATIVDGKLHSVAAGTTTIIANQSGAALYNAAPSVSQELRVVEGVTGLLSLGVEADAYVHLSKSNTNFGAAADMITKGEGRYGYLKFDLSTIPGTIISATLRIYQRTGYKDLRVVYDVADDNWTETGITWANKPTYTNERASTTTTSTWSEWDISSYTAQEYNGDKIITVVVKAPASSTSGIDFRSKDFDPAVAPELVVEYSNHALHTDKAIQKSIGLYPNPVIDGFTITNSKGAEIELYTMLGACVLKNKIDRNKQFVSMTLLNSGVYFVRVYKDGIVAVKRIIKE